jgi:hypothetical protein
VTTFTIHQSVAVVEHDDQTRQPREGGHVYPASVDAVNGVFTVVRYGGNYGLPLLFDTGSGWAAAHAEYRWRLVPLCGRADCDKPVLTPVLADSDPLRRQWHSTDCRDADAETWHEGHYPSGVAT